MVMNNQASSIRIEKLVGVNQIVLLIGGTTYGVLYVLGSQMGMGAAIIISTLILVSTSNFFKKRGNIDACTAILTNVQLALIVGFGLIGRNLAASLPLIAGSLAFTGIYYKPKMLKTQSIISSIVLFVCIFFGESIYGAFGFGNILRGFLGWGFCVLFVNLLVKWGTEYLDDSAVKEAQSVDLVKQVEEKMEESKKSAETQHKIFGEVGRRSSNLENTSQRMLDIATVLKEGSQNQAYIIEELSEQSLAIQKEVTTAQKMAAQSRDSATNSVDKLEQNNALMNNIVEAISEVERSSQRIIGIIKSIEDIAFQTNILALNASVEAARAGSAGRGFAVVAEEVRTLASNSSKAANDSAKLVHESARNVTKSVELVKSAVSNMGEVIDFSKEAAKNADNINSVMAEQVESINNILMQMQSISGDISRTAATAEQSTSIANEITDELRFINAAIRN